MSVFLVALLKSFVTLALALVAIRMRCLTASARHAVLLVALLSLPAMLLLPGVVAPTSIGSLSIDLLAESYSYPLVTREQAASVGVGVALLGASGREIAVVFYATIVFLLVTVWTWQLVRTSRWIAATGTLHTLKDDVIRRRILLCAADRVTSPHTWGVLRPIIVVPSNWERWSDAARRAALVHECAHVRRFDVASMSLSQLICCIFWANPLAWAVLRQLRHQAELACDDAVLEDGVVPEEYASQLLAMARMDIRLTVPAAMVGSSLSMRIKALLNPRKRRHAMSMPRRFLLGAAVLAVLTPIAFVQISIASAHKTATSIFAIQGSTVSERLSAAQSEIDGGDYGNAAGVLERLLDGSALLTAAERGHVHYVLADVYAQMNRYDDAMRQYERVASLGGNVHSNVRLATLEGVARLMPAGLNYSRALAFVDLWLEHEPHPGPVALVFKAQLLYLLQDYSRATRSLERGIHRAQAIGEPVRENWWQLLAYLHYESGDLTRAADVIEQLLAEHPKKPEYARQLSGLRHMM